MAQKVCVVFGFGPGIGAACARRWIKEGFKVAIVARWESLRSVFLMNSTLPDYLYKPEAQLVVVPVVPWNHSIFESGHMEPLNF